MKCNFLPKICKTENNFLLYREAASGADGGKTVAVALQLSKLRIYTIINDEKSIVSVLLLAITFGFFGKSKAQEKDSLYEARKLKN